MNVETPKDPQSDEQDIADPALVEELDAFLAQTKGHIGGVSRLLQSGVTDRKELLEQGPSANAGALGILLVNIAAIREGRIPTAPTMAQGALGSSRSFLRQHRERMSPRAVAHLEYVIEQLDRSANDRAAQEKEDEDLISRGDALEESLADGGGVYVYTYPHYWRFRTVEESNRTLLKIGMSNVGTGERVRQQARQSGMPEDPLLLRVYRSSTVSPRDLERLFHRLLRAADHDRDSGTSAGGVEWFETSTEFLDTIAEVLGLEVLDLGDLPSD
jgi:hypothetical protein